MSPRAIHTSRTIVLLAKVTPCFENGKAGIARRLRQYRIGFGSSEFYVLRHGPQVLPEWIYYCVMHPLSANLPPRR